MDPVEEKVYDGRLHHPSSFFIAGPSSSGKTVFTKRLLLNRDLLFDKKVDKIVWCYGHYQDLFDDPELKDVRFVQGFQQEMFAMDEGPRIVIIDDLMNELSDNKEFINMFVKNRHINVTTIFLTQCLFYKSNVYRCISLNANYFVIMRMLRDKKQLSVLVSQAFPDRAQFAKNAIAHATRKPFSYILIDMLQTTPDELRLRTRLFPDEWGVSERDGDDFYAQTVYPLPG